MGLGRELSLFGGGHPGLQNLTIKSIENLNFSILTLQGKFTIAAKHHITIAEIYETESVDIEQVSYLFLL